MNKVLGFFAVLVVGVIFSGLEAGKMMNKMTAKATKPDNTLRVINSEDLSREIDELEQKMLIITTRTAEEEAKWWLRAIRQSVRDNAGMIDALKESALEAGRSLEEVGTNEEELANLLTKGYKAEARYWLSVAKNQPKDKENEEIVWRVRYYIAKAKCSLEEIGTSEMELIKLLPLRYKPRNGLIMA